MIKHYLAKSFNFSPRDVDNMRESEIMGYILIENFYAEKHEIEKTMGKQ